MFEKETAGWPQTRRARCHLPPTKLRPQWCVHEFPKRSTGHTAEVHGSGAFAVWAAARTYGVSQRRTCFSQALGHIRTSRSPCSCGSSAGSLPCDGAGGGRFQWALGCWMFYLRLNRLEERNEPCRTGVRLRWAPREYFVGTSRYLLPLVCRPCQEFVTLGETFILALFARHGCQLAHKRLPTCSTQPKAFFDCDRM